MGKSLTTKEFISKAQLIHGALYGYDKVIYVAAKQKITITCHLHGDFKQIPNSHLNGSGCPTCGREKCDKTRKHTQKSFIKKANLVHDNKYSYSKVVYTESRNKISITCPAHGEFEQLAADHLSGKGCRSCGNEVISKKLSSNTDRWKSQAVKIHGTVYNYDNACYVNSQTKIKILCQTHGEFLQSPYDHLTGSGCPACAKYGFDKTKPAYLYYLKITTEDNQVLYKIGITNKTVNERFQLNDLNKIEIIKQKLYEKGIDALTWETKLKRKYKKYQYKGPDILSSGNTELFTEDIISMWYN